MICRRPGCGFDLANCTMQAVWHARPGDCRELVISLQCPQCGQDHQTTPHHIYGLHFQPVAAPPDG